MRVGEDNYEIFERVSEITMTDYDIKWWDSHNIQGYIEPDSLLDMIEDLICEVDRLEEKIEHIIQDRNDNYRQLTPKEMYDL